MLTKCSEIKHPSGYIFETPLLIPSFSSKGFSFYKDKKKNKIKSDVCYPLKIATEFLTECMLISAYDVYYGFLPKLEDFVCTQITFIDSGGYETANSYDSSETFKEKRNIKKWGLEFYEKTLRNWPDRYPAVIVNFDKASLHIPINEQIENADHLFKKHKQFLNDFLIKPETNTSKYIKIENVLSEIESLKKFDIIGFTERELNNSILRRMVDIYKLRKVLDECKIKTPIHIFGSLDPITTILYYLAGAEVFDGLTWLKYSYHNGMAIYRNNNIVCNNKVGIQTLDKQANSISLTDNIYYLSNLKLTLQTYHQYQDFNCFNEYADGLSVIIEKSMNKFYTNLKNHKLI